MVAINSDASESILLELAEPIDSVGRLDIITYRTRVLKKFKTGTATLVAPNKILTAAHVIDTDLDGVADIKDVSQYSFLLGDNVKTPEQKISVSQISLHPYWVAGEENRFNTVDGKKFNNSRFDLAVLTLESDITDIAPIPISPNVAELAADNASLLGKKATLVGYGKYGHPNALLLSDGSRRAAENIIDSVDNSLIRFDYDSTLSFQQQPDTGINSPSFDGATPEVEPVPASSPLPIPLEGEIGKGDSGGPLLVSTESNNTAIVGVASEFIDPNALTVPTPGYGSVDVYTAFDHPATLKFLDAENLLLDSGRIRAAEAVVSPPTQTTNVAEGNALGANASLESSESDNSLVETDLFVTRDDELSFIFNSDFDFE